MAEFNDICRKIKTVEKEGDESEGGARRKKQYFHSNSRIFQGRNHRHGHSGSWCVDVQRPIDKLRFASFLHVMLDFARFLAIVDGQRSIDKQGFATCLEVTLGAAAFFGVIDEQWSFESCVCSIHASCRWATVHRQTTFCSIFASHTLGFARVVFCSCRRPTPHRQAAFCSIFARHTLGFARFLGVVDGQRSIGKPCFATFLQVRVWQHVAAIFEVVDGQQSIDKSLFAAFLQVVDGQRSIDVMRTFSTQPRAEIQRPLSSLRLNPASHEKRIFFAKLSKAK